jgi:abortive infection bacteriophage resistance protein
MTKKVYNKARLSYEQQIQKLEEKNLNFRDKVKAKYHLQHIGYYRLSGYWFHRKENNSNKFEDKNYFEDFVEAYLEDEKLKFLLMACLLKLEISLRANMAYVFSSLLGSYFLYDKDYFNSYFKSDTKIIESLTKSKETFAEHAVKNYELRSIPPWIYLETSTFGNLYNLYKNLKSKPKTSKIINVIQAKKQVALIYGVQKNSLFESALHSLYVVRNACAHHSRLWHKKLNSKAALLKNLIDKEYWNLDNYESNKIFNSYLILRHLMKSANLQYNELNQLEKFFKNSEKYKIEYGISERYFEAHRE